jgi:BirA family transcriptional regulator, biotin operon repressor / biotin---[acetyl-CoA-carboxylase] ligase
MRIVHLGSVTSTQDVARDLPLGTVVVADHQSAGRGRLDRVWEAPAGTGLHATFVLPLRPLALFTAGVAAVEACGRPCRLKWPNDLHLHGRKVGGLLAEQHADRCLVGIGINLSWSPPGAARLGVPREALLPRLVDSIEEWWPRDDNEVLDAWREHSDTLGRLVRVELPDQTLEGVAEAIDPDGALVVGGRRVVVGDVVHLDAAPGDSSRV